VNPRLSVLAASLLLVACGAPPSSIDDQEGSAASAADAAVLHVYNWSDYIADDTLAGFQDETGIRVIYDVYDSNEMLEAKLMAGRSGYDLVFPSARPHAERHIETGIYRPLDRDQLQNLGNLDPAVLAGLQDLDPGNRHVLPYMWGTTGLGINTARVREVLGEDAALDSWSLLFDPANAARLAECGIAILDDQQEGFGAALLWLGRDPNQHDAESVDAVQKAFADIRPHVRYFHSSRYIDDLADGSICLALGYSGDVFQARDRADEAGTDVVIEYVIPNEGALRWVDVMAIPADAPHVENAHRFIDYLLRPEVIAAISDHVAYANPNLPARALLDPEVAGDPGIYPPDEVLAKLVDPRSLDDAAQRERVRAWTAIRSGQ
jgi:putrescine transport system substrate-binding protein